MAVNCRMLLNLECFKQIRLLGGEAGLDNIVTWPYVVHTDTVSQWLYGGELLFITGIGRQNLLEKQKELMYESANKKLSGIVFLCGEGYITEISQELIELANELNLPIFEMPWDIKLIDLTKEIANFITFSEFEQRHASNFLSELLFSEYIDYESLLRQGHFCNVNLNEKSFFCTILSHCPDLENEQMKMQLQKLQSKMEEVCNEYKCKCLSILRNEYLICYVYLGGNGTKEDILNGMKPYFQSDTHILNYCGCGSCYSEIDNLKSSYEESRKALKIASKLQKTSYICDYEKMGIMRLLLHHNSVEDLRQYCDEVLGPLKEYDEKEGTEYVRTLGEYLNCNCNLVVTAKALFIHRNTMVYRMEKIQKLINHDLDDASERIEYINAIQIMKFLDGI